MAKTVVGNLVVQLIANTKRFKAGMRSASKETQRFSGRVSTATKSLAKMAGPLIGVTAAATALFKVAAASENFNAAMQSSLAIMDDVSDAMRDKMSKAAQEVARVTVFSGKEAAEAFFFLASAGLTAEQSIKALPAVAKFAQAGMFGLSRATELLGGSQAAMGLQSKNAQQNLINLTRVSDVLVKANRLSQATTEQFAEALGNRAAAAARFASVSVEETVGVLAAFAKQQIKGAEAGTAFDIVLRELIRRANENKEAFKAMGVTVLDTEGRFLGFKTAIGSLENALKGMTVGQKTATLAQLGFTFKSIANIKVLLGMSDAIGEYTTKLQKAAGTTDKVSSKQLTAFRKGWEKIKAAIESLAIGALTPILSALGDVLGLVADILNVTLIPAFKLLGSIIGPIFKLIRDAVGGIGSFVGKIGTQFAKNFTKVFGGGKAPAAPTVPDVAAPISEAQKEFDAAAEAAAKASKEFAKVTVKLEEEVAAFGQSTFAIRRYKIGLEEVTAAEKMAALTLINRLEAMTTAQRQTDELAEQAKAVFEATQTPLEKFNATMLDLQKLQRVGAIDWNIYSRAVQKARKELAGTRGGVPAAPAALEFGTQAAITAIAEAQRAQAEAAEEDKELQELVGLGMRQADGIEELVAIWAGGGARQTVLRDAG